MPPKKEKPAPKPPLVACVDKTFYQLTTEDLRKKCAHMQTAIGSRFERNTELEELMRVMEMERTDELAVENRKQKQQTIDIRDLREDLLATQTRLDSELAERERILREDDLKFKLMHETLTSDLKLQLSTLNSLNEFQQNRAELTVKLDRQDEELRRLKEQHRQMIWNMERKELIDKSLLKKVIESKLCDISLEVARENEIQIPAHVRRLMRENIALNNELDRMQHSQKRLRRENQAYWAEQKNTSETLDAERTRLVRTCNERIGVIRKTTDNLESMQKENAHFCNAERLCTAAAKQEHHTERAHCEHAMLVHRLKQLVQAERYECLQHRTAFKRLTMDVQRMDSILQQLRMAVKSAKRGDNCNCDDPAFRADQRKNLLHDLMDIVQLVHEPLSAMPSFATVGSLREICSAHELSKETKNVRKSMRMENLLRQRVPVGCLQASITKAGERIAERANEMRAVPDSSYESIHRILDLQSGSELFMSDRSLRIPSLIIELSARSIESVESRSTSDAEEEYDGGDEEPITGDVAAKKLEESEEEIHEEDGCEEVLEEEQVETD